jgi:hypothetical protein
MEPQVAPPKQDNSVPQVDPDITTRSQKVAEQPEEYIQSESDDFWDEDRPPPPVPFPSEWDEMYEPPMKTYDERIATATAAQEEETISGKTELPQDAQVEEVAAPEDESQPQEAETPGMPVETVSQEDDPSVSVLKAKVSETIITPMIPPMPPIDGDEIHMITVILRPRADKIRDNLLLRRVFGLMISYPGNDRFAFHIFENGRGHLLEFPNLTTGLNPELTARLHDLVGPENVRIEPITFQ